MPISRQARITRKAISPRLAMRILLNISGSRLISRQPGAASPHRPVSKIEHFEPEPCGTKKFPPTEKVSNVFSCQRSLVPGRLQRDEAIPEMVGKSNGSVRANVTRGQDAHEQ